MKSRRSNLIRAAIGAACAIPGTAFAEELEEVVIYGVAASARAGLFGDKPIQDIPFSVTGFTDELIKDQQLRTTKDLVLNDPSVRSASASDGETEHFLIRGLAYLQNEIAFDGLFGLVSTRRSGLDFAERVEIFKGPNALLNGLSPFGAVGGVINVVPKRAKAQPNTNFALSYASDSNIGGRVDIGRRVGDEQRFGIRFNGSYRDGDTQTDDAENRYASADLALDYRGERLGVTLDLGYADDELTGVQNLLSVLGGFQIPDAPAATENLGQPWALFKTDATRVVGGVSYALSDSWTASIRYGILDHFEDYKTPASFRINNAAGEYRWRSLSQVATFDTHTGDVGIRGRFGTGPIQHDLAVSATNYFADNKFAFDFGPFLLSNLYAPVYTARPDFSTAQTVPLPGNEREFTTYAIADTLAVFDERLQVTLGVRRQKIDVTNFIGATGAVLNRIEQSKTSPAYGVLYKFTDRWSGYANATEALATGPQAPGGTVNQGQVFPPIEADQYEVGVKGDFGGFGATAAVFETTQPFGFINPANNTFVVDGETRIRGIELNVFGSPAPSVRLLGGITRLDGEQTRTAGGLTNGLDAVAIPHLQYNVYGDWQPEILTGLSANARVIYSDKQFLDPANTQWIGDWTRLDLGLRHTLGSKRPTTLRLNVENVLDEDYWQSTARAGVTRGGPRTILFSAELSL